MLPRQAMKIFPVFPLLRERPELQPFTMWLANANIQQGSRAAPGNASGLPFDPSGGPPLLLHWFRFNAVGVSGVWPG